MRGPLRLSTIWLALLFSMSGCAMCSPPRDWQSASKQFPGPGHGFAKLYDADGRSVGDLRLRAVGETTEADAELFGLGPGDYVFGVDARGVCEQRGGAPPTSSGHLLAVGPAGEKWIPFRVGGDGGAKFRTWLPNAPLTALFDGDGSAVTLASPGGAPVACGVLRR